jgi:flavin reductase (DIM6/NTAB) family NADH-FMN oxidoreductase RutF
MGQMPSPVTIVTAAREQQARGITIGSFTSLSMDPPLISFNVDIDSQMHDVITETNRFAVHIPSREEAELCNHFAVPDQTGREQLETVPHHLNRHGTPILEQVLAVINCRTHASFSAGDHTIIAGEVLQIQTLKDGVPLLYQDQAYHQIGRQIPTA